MSLKDLALKTIETGAWTFDELAPRFRSALMNRILSGQEGHIESLGSQSLMEITLRAYEPGATASWKGFRESQKFMNRATATDDLAIQALIAEKVFSGGKPSSFSHEELVLMSEAESFLRNFAPITSQLMDRWVRSFMKLTNVPFRSGSHPHAFGCIFWGERISEFSAAAVATSIVHEMAHQELFLLNLLDRLVESDADFKLAHAPFQGTKRPTIGRLHSFYALFRMVEFERAAGLSSSHHVDLLMATAETFEPNDLTEYGQRLVRAVETRIKAGVEIRNAVNL